MAHPTQQPSRMVRVMKSHSELPVWVQAWMNFILGPVNLTTLLFLGEPSGALIAALSLSGMALTVAIVVASGGFSKVAAAGHILPWTPLVLMLAFAKPDGSSIYQIFLTVLLIVNVISLVFDFNDLRIWAGSKGQAAAQTA